MSMLHIPTPTLTKPTFEEEGKKNLAKSKLKISRRKREKRGKIEQKQEQKIVKKRKSSPLQSVALRLYPRYAIRPLEVSTTRAVGEEVF